MNLLTVFKQRRLMVIGALLLLVGVGGLSSRILTRQAAIVDGLSQNTIVDERSNTAAPPGIEKSSATHVEGETKLLGDTIAGSAAKTGYRADDRADVDQIVPAGTVLPPLNDRIIKTGSMTLKVKKGRFGPVFDQVVLVAAANGGYVAGSSSAATAGTPVSGILTLKIPSKNFELVVARLRRFGKVTAMDVNSQDVSSEFVDLESRLRHWRAQETVLLGLMEKAQTIGDSIVIQEQLSRLQMEMEQITGRLNYLKDQTAFSSLQVNVTEGRGIVAVGDSWGFKAAVDQAAHAFVDTVSGLVLLAGYLSPLLILAGLAGSIWVGVRRRLHGGAAVGA